MELRLKSAREPAAEGDGARLLVDRLWPRGVSKQRLALATWAKDVAPSSELRRCVEAHRAARHDPRRHHRTLIRAVRAQLVRPRAVAVARVPAALPR